MDKLIRLYTVRNKAILLGLLLAVVALVFVYLYWDLPPQQFNYMFPRRIQKIIGVLIAGAAVAISSVLFQTITNNRILTPAIIGFDALYLLIQGITVFVAGAAGTALLGPEVDYIVNIVFMIVFSEILYRLLFQRESSYIYFILLAGVVCGMVFRSGFNFFTLLLSPEEYDIIQTKMFATFNLVSPSLLIMSGTVLLLICAYLYRWIPKLDVFLLGRENAHTLGVDTSVLQQRILRIIAVLVAISTALVGPITFLGLLVVNIGYQLFVTYKHSYLLVGVTLISWCSLFAALLVVERFITFPTNITVIINGIGGSYFIYLLLKGKQ